MVKVDNLLEHITDLMTIYYLSYQIDGRMFLIFMRIFKIFLFFIECSHKIHMKNSNEPPISKVRCKVRMWGKN